MIAPFVVVLYAVSAFQVISWGDPMGLTTVVLIGTAIGYSLVTLLAAAALRLTFRD